MKKTAAIMKIYFELKAKIIPLGIQDGPPSKKENLFFILFFQI